MGYTRVIRIEGTIPTIQKCTHTFKGVYKLLKQAVTSGHGLFMFYETGGSNRPGFSSLSNRRLYTNGFDLLRSFRLTCMDAITLPATIRSTIPMSKS